MGKFKFIMLAMLICLVSGCSKESSNEPTEQYTYDKILGNWGVTSYLTSGGNFMPSNNGEYYEFAKSGTYTHGGGYYDIENGTFSFDPETNIIVCKEPRGWDFTVKVAFSGENNATFDITGKTQVQSKTIKVERK